MTEADYIEFSFIQRALKKYGMTLREILIKDIGGKDLRKTGELSESISFTVKRAGEKGGELLLTFPNYGRFIEIHYFKRTQNSSRLVMPNTNQILWGIRSKKKRTRKKDTRWYTRNVMGLLNELEGELMYGFTEAVRQDLFDKLVGPYNS